MNKQKRMVYIYEENVEFYDSLENKSQFINDALQDTRLNKRVGAKNPDGSAKNTNSDPYEGVDYHLDPRIVETQRRIEEIDAQKRAAKG